MFMNLVHLKLDAEVWDHDLEIRQHFR